MLFIFLEGKYRLCHQIIYNVINFFRGSTDYAIKSFRMLFIFRGSTDYAIKSFTMLFIFRGTTDYAMKSFRMLFIFLEGVQIMPSNHLQCYLFF